MGEDLRLTDHFGHHKAFGYAAIACAGLWLALIGPLGIELPFTFAEPVGLLFALSGWKAILAGRSMFTEAMGAHFGTTLRLDRMNPHQRRRHGRISGALLIAGGIATFVVGLEFDLVRHGILTEPVLMRL